MAYQPFRATVVDSTRISPSFQRVRLSGLKEMGPAGAIHDLRIKLIIPGPAGLPELPAAEDWFSSWQKLDPATRGAMRTYSVRDLDRENGILTVDFVLHTAPGQTGPASSWAHAAKPGDSIYVIAPHATDAPGPGIEFQPGESREIHILGDETALPAIARILDEWPTGLTGTVHIAVPYFQDAQALAAPAGVKVEFLPHDEASLIGALAHLAGLPSPAPADKDLQPNSLSSVVEREILWETPAYSSSGEELGERAASDAYWWIAGESGVVKRMRRLLVKEAGVPRSAVSFMGYWKRGVSEGWSSTPRILSRYSGRSKHFHVLIRRIMAKIIWTRTDEAPLLATYSFKPVVEAFASTADIEVETRDISLAGRILAQFPERLGDKKVEDALAELGKLAKTPEANIIKLPNISASLVQLKKAIAELQAAGYDVPDYEDAQEAYAVVTGSAVNPVLREGNSDRRAPIAVKNFAKKYPHKMGAWSADSKTNVATMSDNDFRHNEKSVILEQDDTLSIKLVAEDGTETVLLEKLPVLKGEVVDGTFISAKALDEFLKAQVARAKEEGVLFSAHLKATMMKVSDPIIFGHVVRAYFADVFAQYGEQLEAAGLNGENGLGAIYEGLNSLENGEEINAAFDAALENGPDLAMVNSAKGISNLHVPSDVIIDASMPAMIRTSGHMWNKNDEEQDTLAVIPDSSYAGVYQAVIDDCKANGAFDPSTMGTVPNVGLMAQKAEEYGSHNKTFKVPENGTVQLTNSAGDVLIEHDVEAGDIWRACQTKDAPIQDWVKLAVNRARLSGMKTIFWLDPERAHDRNITSLVEKYLQDHDTEGLDISIASPVEATKISIERIRKGEDTISVTGNVLRDYNTDLFPILELGTSAKMLSVVPLMAGGGLFETGAGGSAPKHVQQVEEENHLRWDSLGEFLALAESFHHELNAHGNTKAGVLADALDKATETLLDEGNSPSRKVGENDNRGSHFHLTLNWAKELAAQTEDTELAETFKPVAEALEAKKDEIQQGLLDVQGSPADLGGYYAPDEEKISSVMRPVAAFNEIIDGLKK